MLEKECRNSRLSIMNLYRDQLKIFKKIGLGNKTAHNTVITPKLIDCTKKRLSELSTSYDATLTYNAQKWRIAKFEQLAKDKV